MAALRKVHLALRGIEAAGPGYLSLTRGDAVELLYLGAGSEEQGWAYGREVSSGAKGWFPQGALRSEGAAPGKEDANGEEAVAAADWRAPGDGYVALRKGERVLVQYVGSEASRDDGWLFGRAEAGGGWFPASMLCRPSGPEKTGSGATERPPLPPTPPPNARQCRERSPEKSKQTPPSEQKGQLKLLGDIAPEGTKWQYVLQDEAQRCYVGLVRGLLAEAECRKLMRRLMDAMDDLRWDRPMSGLGMISRGTKWLTREGHHCAYRYGGVSVNPTPFPEWMDEILAMVMPHCGLPDQKDWPNCCNMNFYGDGSEGVEWHADDEELFQGKERPIRIVSLSLGEERAFELREAKFGPGAPASTALRLKAGDLCSMEGYLQKFYEHRVPKGGGRTVRARLNLTWRWILQNDKARWGS